MRRALLFLLLAASFSVEGSAQIIEGTAFDSLTGRPLAGAFIFLSPIGKSTISGVDGKFRFDSLSVGRFVLRMQHDYIDSVGLSGVSVPVDVGTGVTRVVTAVPSFAALWRSVCPGSPPPRDSGLIFGRVRTAGFEVKPPTAVEALWLDVGYDKRAGVTQKQWHFSTSTDSLGSYVACGVPTTTAIRLLAIVGGDTSSAIDLSPLDLRRVARADLYVRHQISGGTTPGAIRGLVTTIEKTPIENADVSVGPRSVKTDTRGAFLLDALPPGNLLLTVRAIGIGTLSKGVDVRPGDTAHVDVQLAKVVELDSITVKGRPAASDIVRTQLAADIDARRRKGFGYFRDSLQLSGYPEMSTVFREVPSVTLGRNQSVEVYVPGSGSQATKGLCLANLWIDGIKQVKLDRGNPPDYTEVLFLKPEDLAMVEVYPTMMQTPAQYVNRGNSMSMCGTVLIWTKRAIRH